MAKKFGKFLLATAAIGTAAAAAYYFLKKNDQGNDDVDDSSDEDYDDFSSDLKKTEETSRNYVPLNPSSPAPEAEDVPYIVVEDTKDAAPGKEDDFLDDSLKNTEDGFTSLADQAISTVEEKAEETVEEFFDDEN